jgi:hypothetical protein
MSTSFSDEWASLAKLSAEANRLNKAVVFDALSEAGITHVCVGFDGEGDEGQMERAAAQANGRAVDFPAVRLRLRLSHFGNAELATYEMGLQEAVEHICYGYLEEEHGGWEINEGSFGEFTFDVAAQTITLQYFERIVDTEHSSHTF